MKKEMRYAYEVYKEKSFSKAAKALFISQPALSAIIKRLEAELQEPLFDRSTNPIRLTDAGVYYMQNVEQIMAIENNMHDYFEDRSDLKKGSLRIGGTTFFCAYVISPLIHQFTSAYPGIHLDLIETSSMELETLLLEGKLDLIFDSTPFNTDLVEKNSLYEEEILLAVPASWEINQQLVSSRFTFSEIREDQHLISNRFVPLSLFADLPFLFLREGNDLYSRCLSICRDAGFSPNISMHLDQMTTLYHLAKAQMGAAFLRDSVMHYEFPTDQLYFYRLDSPLNKRQVSISYKKNRYLSKAMKAFITFYQNAYQA